MDAFTLALETKLKTVSLTSLTHFFSQAQRAPHRTCVVSPPGRTLTYGAMNAVANAVAWQIRARAGVRSGFDSVVALVVERSELMIIGMLATLKAGGVYCIIDPQYPVDRIAYILK